MRVQWQVNEAQQLAQDRAMALRLLLATDDHAHRELALVNEAAM